MKIKIKGNVSITEALKTFVEQEVEAKLTSFEGYIEKITVCLTVNKSHKKADQQNRVEVLTTVRGSKSSRVNKISVTADDMYKAITIATDKAEQQVIKHKEKAHRRSENNFFMYEVPSCNENNILDASVLRVKEFDLKPMFVEEAIDQMIILGHNFFLYLDESTNKPSVVYRRNDGNYGIIEGAM